MNVFNQLRQMFVPKHEHLDVLTAEAESSRKRAHRAIESWDQREALLQAERQQRDRVARTIREAQQRAQSGDD